MDTRVIRIDEQHIEESVIREAGEIIKEGGLVAFPTETVYGLGGDALNPSSSQKIYEAKGRPSDNPLIVHIASMEALPAIVKSVPETAKKLAAAFWPGPLTMIFEKSETVPKETTGGLETVAVRMPSDPIAQAFIEAAGGYVAAPSANRSGRPSPTRAVYVKEDLKGRIEMILDGGDASLGLESTIVDLTVKVPVILRPGFVTEGMLEEVLGAVEQDATLFRDDSGQAPKAPGMKYRHYAPKGELAIVRGAAVSVTAYINERLGEGRRANKKTGVIATDETIGTYKADVPRSVGKRADMNAAARGLYRILREFDDEGVELIYSESFDGAGISQAVMNRLLKAAGHKIIDVSDKRRKNNMIAIGSDHGGFDLKQKVIAHLKERGLECKDFGCPDKNSCDYPVYGAAVAKAVASGECDRGIVICTTGIGISIAANKVKGIRCALCGDPVSARLTREHNDANVLAMGATIIGEAVALNIVDIFLDTPFSHGERHERRVGLIENC